MTEVRNQCFMPTCVGLKIVIPHMISSAYGLTSEVFGTDDALPVRKFLDGDVHQKATLIFIAAV